MHWYKMTNGRWGWGRRPYYSKVPDHKRIGRYVKNFPVKMELKKGTKVAVQAACKKYLGRSYLYMNYDKIKTYEEGTWVYHNGFLYLKNPDDHSIVTLAMLAKR